MPKKSKFIDYTSRDFDSIKKSLIEYSKRYYPNSYQDFSKAGFGSLMMDTVSYIGDSLSFYLDYQANETFLQNASEIDNVIALAKQSGYKFTNTPSSQGLAAFFVLVPASGDGTKINQSYIPVLKAGAELMSKNGTSFILDQDVDFKNGEATAARFDSSTNAVTYYALKAYGKVSSGTKSTAETVVGEYKKFKRVTVSIADVNEIISVTDSLGNEYYEVDYLSQNTVYKAIKNVDPGTRTQAPQIMKPFVASRRFTTDFFRDRVELQFGAGQEEDFAADKALDPSNIAMKISGKHYVTDEVLDPNKLVSSDKMGVSPANTTLFITYRRNTTSNTNVASNTLDKVVRKEISFDNEELLSNSVSTVVRGSLETTNDEPITGDNVDLTVEDIKVRAMNTFGAQNRAVTEQDYEAMCYLMPAKFGSVKRAKICKDPQSVRKNMNIYVLTENVDGSLTTANTILKNNLKTWVSKNKMINDTVDILDGKIVNFGINFSISAREDYESADVLNNCLLKLQEVYAEKVAHIGEDFSISEIYQHLNAVEGVLDTQNVSIVNKTGTSYSGIYLDIDKHTSRDGRDINLPKNVVYEIKLPKADIKGSVI
jgi:hypothetical protein